MPGDEVTQVVGPSDDAISVFADGFAAPVKQIDNNVSQMLSVVRQGFSSSGGGKDGVNDSSGLVSVVMAKDSMSNLTDAIRNVLEMSLREWKTSLEEDEQKQTGGGTEPSDEETSAPATPRRRRSGGGSGGGTEPDDATKLVTSVVEKMQDQNLATYKMSDAIKEIRESLVGQGVDEQKALVQANESINRVLNEQKSSAEKYEKAQERIEARAAAVARLGEEVVSKMTDEEIAQEERDRQAERDKADADREKVKSAGKSALGTDTQKGSLQKMVKDVGSGNMFGAARDLVEGGSTIGDAASTAASMLPEGSSLASLLGGLGDVATTALPVIGAGAAAIGGAAALYSGTQDVAQQNQSLAAQYGMTGQNSLALGTEMGVQAKMTGFTTGLDESQASQLQKSLMSGQADFGTSEYNQGYDFAVSSWQNRGIDTSKAAQYYTDMVVKGGASMKQLDDAMNSLTNTVNNSDYTMQEAEAQLQSTTQSLTAYTGGNTYSAEIASAELSNMSGDTTTASSLAGISGQYNWSTDVYANQAQAQVMSQNPGMSEVQAETLTSLNLMSQGYGLSGSALLYSQVPLSDDDDRTFLQYVQQGDFDGLRSALDSLQQERTNSHALTWAGLTSYLMKTLGFPQQSATDVDSIVEYAQQLYGGVQGVENGESNQAQKEKDAGQTFGEQGWTTKSILGVSGFGLDNVQDPLSTMKAEWNLDKDVKNGTFSSSSSANGITGWSDKDRMLLSLYRSGTLSRDELDSLTDTNSKELTNSVYEAYNSTDKSQSFSSWVADSSNADELNQIIDKYAGSEDPGTSSTSSTSSSAKVSLTVGFSDDAGKFIWLKNNETGQKYGLDSGKES